MTQFRKKKSWSDAGFLWFSGWPTCLLVFSFVNCSVTMATEKQEASYICTVGSVNNQCLFFFTGELIDEQEKCITIIIHIKKYSLDCHEILVQSTWWWLTDQFNSIAVILIITVSLLSTWGSLCSRVRLRCQPAIRNHFIYSSAICRIKYINYEYTLYAFRFQYFQE